MYYMLTRWFGTFIMKMDGGEWEEVEFVPASQDPAVIADELNHIINGDVLMREKELLDRYEVDEVEEARLSKDGGPEVAGPYDIMIPDPMERGFENSLLVTANLNLASIGKKEWIDDSNILSAIGALTEVDASLNTTTERIREWYAKYWPDLAEVIDDRNVLDAISMSSDPEMILGYLKESDPELASKLEGSGLPDLDPDLDLSGMTPLASLVLYHWKVREELEAYVESEMGICAPNLAMVAGPLIGARLIDSAGGIQRLSRLPASTVQVLGAEKMFFKFLKEGGKPPKHGLLFQHPWVHSLPQRKRGKMARSIASAASLAVRMDAHGGGDASGIKEKLEKRAESIREMEIKPRSSGGRQPPFREGWWANKGGGRKGRRRPRRKR